MANTEKPGDLIIVSGPVGAGKTAVAKELIQLIPAPSVFIEGDTFWPHIMTVTERQKKHMVFRAIMRAMSAAAVAYAATGFYVILDFSMPQGYLETIRKMAEPRGISVDFVVIRPSEEICAARAANREEGKIEDYGLYREMYAMFAAESEAYAVKDDEADPKTLATRIQERLVAGTFRAI